MITIFFPILRELGINNNNKLFVIDSFNQSFFISSILSTGCSYHKPFKYPMNQYLTFMISHKRLKVYGSIGLNEVLLGIYNSGICICN